MNRSPLFSPHTEAHPPTCLSPRTSPANRKVLVEADSARRADSELQALRRELQAANEALNKARADANEVRDRLRSAEVGVLVWVRARCARLHARVCMRTVCVRTCANVTVGTRMWVLGGGVNQYAMDV